MRTARVVLELVRLPNLFTAAADPLAGALAASGFMGVAAPAPALWGLALAGALFYAGGVTLNAYVDVEVDRRERPERVLPRGDASPQAALALSIGLLAAGWVLATLLLSGMARGLPAALVGCIVLYNAASKHSPWAGPLVMGACRGLNMALGLALIPGGLAKLWWAALLATVHVAAITFLARAETGWPTFGQWGGMTVGTAAVVISWLVIVRCSMDATPLGAYLLLGLYGAVGVRSTVALLRDGDPMLVRRAVKGGIFALLFLHGALVAAAAGLEETLLVVTLLIPAAVTARWLDMT